MRMCNFHLSLQSCWLVLNWVSICTQSPVNTVAKLISWTITCSYTWLRQLRLRHIVQQIWGNTATVLQQYSYVQYCMIFWLDEHYKIVLLHVMEIQFKYLSELFRQINSCIHYFWLKLYKYVTSCNFLSSNIPAKWNLSGILVLY